MNFGKNSGGGTDEKLRQITGPEFFEAHEGTDFQVTTDHGTATVRLAAVRSLAGAGQKNPRGREPFSLIFRAESREFFLPQSVYRIAHPVLGDLDVFLVPVGPDATGMCFEAVFN